MNAPDLALAEKFNSLWMPEPNAGCWLWLSTVSGRGYGSFFWKGRSRAAHRVAYELSGRSIPVELVIDHKCRVRSCVNPGHLRVVTSRENTLIGEGPTAINATKTHCKAGHPLGATTKRGWRECRPCKAAWAREVYALSRYRATPEEQT